MLSDLTANQRALAEYMSNLSEEAYCAAWMHGLEFALWQVVLGERREYGRLLVTDEQRMELRALAEAAEGWIVFDEQREETWVPLGAWEGQFKHWQSITPPTRDKVLTSSTQPSNVPYSRSELLEAADGRWPDRGLRCDCCGGVVPEFAELTDADRVRIIGLAFRGQHTLAEAELQACTGAPPQFAKIWVLHAGRPNPRFPGPPCPHCGKPLASSRAKQCLHCHIDWH
jgi:hypothetical protein